MEKRKIGALEVSAVGLGCMGITHAICPVTATQNRYFMMARWYEELFPVVEELGITYVAF